MFISVMLFLTSCFSDAILEQKEHGQITDAQIEFSDPPINANFETQYQVHSDLLAGKYKLVYENTTKTNEKGSYTSTDYGIVDRNNQILFEIGTIIISEDGDNLGMLYIKDKEKFLESKEKYVSSSICLINSDLELVELIQGSYLSTIIETSQEIPRFSGGFYYLISVTDKKYTSLVNTEGNMVVEEKKYSLISNFSKDGTAYADYYYYNPITGAEEVHSALINNKGEVVKDFQEKSFW